jgi:hypothetical protein
MIFTPRRSNSGLIVRHVAELGGADGGEVLRVREQHRPGIADPVVEADAALGGVGLEVGCCIALRWDGLFPIGLPGPEALAELAAEIRAARPDGVFDLITELPPDTDLRPWERAGLTWAVTWFGPQPTEAGVRAVIDAGPG